MFTLRTKMKYEIMFIKFRLVCNATLGVVLFITFSIYAYILNVFSLGNKSQK